MTTTPEDILRDALRNAGGSQGLLAALDALVGERDELAERLQASDEEVAVLRRIADAAARVLEEMGGRRSATPMLSAIAEMRAALRERAAVGR